MAIKIDAGNSLSGNPRRGWMVIDAKDGDPVDFVDEGYMGVSALKRAYPDVVEGPGFVVTPGEYRDQLRFAKKQAERHEKGEI